MAKIERTLQKIFAGSSASIGQIGSLRAGTKLLSTDLTALQALSAFTTGMADIVKSDSLLLSQEELNALFYLITSQLAYIFQDGFPVYESNTTYYTNSIVRQPSTTILYKSKTDNNTGNLLTNGTHWEELGDLANLANEYADLNLSNLNLATALTNLGFAGQSLTANGYYKFPNGFIVQWGAITEGGVTFPIAFPHACLSVAATAQDSGNYATWLSGNPSTTGCTIYVGPPDGGGPGIRYIAVGY